LEYEEELKVAYDWWRGSIPPPKNLEGREDCWDCLEKLVSEQSEESSKSGSELDVPVEPLETLTGVEYSVPLMRLEKMVGASE